MKTAVQEALEQFRNMEWNINPDPQEVVRISKVLQFAVDEPGYSKFLKKLITTLYSDPEYDGPYIEIGKA